MFKSTAHLDARIASEVNICLHFCLVDVGKRKGFEQLTLFLFSYLIGGSKKCYVNILIEAKLGRRTWQGIAIQKTQKSGYFDLKKSLHKTILL